MKIRLLSALVPVLATFILSGCSQPSSQSSTEQGVEQPVATSEVVTNETEQGQPSIQEVSAQGDGQAISGPYTCETLAYKPAGTLLLDGSNYRIDGQTGSYTFDGDHTITWSDGALAEVYGPSVYIAQTKAITLQSKDGDGLKDRVCKF